MTQKKFFKPLPWVLVMALAVLLSFPSQSHAQRWWSETIGMPSNEYAYSICPVGPVGSLGPGYVVVGNIVNVNSDILAIRVNQDGTVAWSTVYFTTNNWDDFARSVCWDWFSNIVGVAGYTVDPATGATDILVLRLNPLTGILGPGSSRTYDLGPGWNDYAQSIIYVDPPIDCFAVAGHYDPAGLPGAFGFKDVFVMELNPTTGSVNATWPRVYGHQPTPEDEYAFSLCYDPGGFYVVAGETRDSPTAVTSEVQVIQCDITFCIAHQRGRYQMPDWDYNAAHCIKCVDPPARYIITGAVASNVAIDGYPSNVLAMELNGLMPDWIKNYDNGIFDIGRCIVPELTAGAAWTGNCVLTGHTDPSISNSNDFLIMSLGLGGSIRWARVLTQSMLVPLFDDDFGFSITNDPHSSYDDYLVAGYTKSWGFGLNDFLVAKLDHNGEVPEQQNLDTLIFEVDTLYEWWIDSVWCMEPEYDWSSPIDYYRVDVIRDVICWAYDLDPDPVITSVSDVGNDQGRQVRVKWDRCYYDDMDMLETITEYSLWRRAESDKFDGWDTEYFSFSGIKVVETVDEMLAQVSQAEPGDQFVVGGKVVWNYIVNVPAMQFEEYAYDAPTECDATLADTCWSVFFVAAHTEDPLVHYDSDPDSGYSMDNIPPLPIQDLGIDLDSWFTLEWTVPGEYEGEQPIATYDIRYNTVPVGADTQAWWDSALACSGDGFFNLTVGEEDSFQVAQETWCHTECYFAIKGLDSRPNASGISNIVHFLCGDVNGDGVVELGDVVKVINYLYRVGPPPEPVATGDVTCDGVVELGDVVYLINYLYRGGPPPCSP